MDAIVLFCEQEFGRSVSISMILYDEKIPSDVRVLVTGSRRHCRAVPYSYPLPMFPSVSVVVVDVHVIVGFVDVYDEMVIVGSCPS